MRTSDTRVYLIARPALAGGLREYMLDHEVPFDAQSSITDGEATPVEVISMVGGKVCYDSWDPDGLNLNLSRVRMTPDDYLPNVIKSGHGSVFEHGMFTFILSNVSRVLTHELVRHRVGTAFSQESGRYVRTDEVEFRVPEVLEPYSAMIQRHVEDGEYLARTLAEDLGLNEPGGDFGRKKVLTSALRRFLPTGSGTTIMFSANVRSLRHLIESRTAKGAEQEIREVFDQIAGVMLREAPILFGDYERSEDGTWTPGTRKV